MTDLERPTCSERGCTNLVQSKGRNPKTGAAMWRGGCDPCRHGEPRQQRRRSEPVPEHIPPERRTARHSMPDVVRLARCRRCGADPGEPCCGFEPAAGDDTMPNPDDYFVHRLERLESTSILFDVNDASGSVPLHAHDLTDWLDVDVDVYIRPSWTSDWHTTGHLPAGRTTATELVLQRTHCVPEADELTKADNSHVRFTMPAARATELAELFDAADLVPSTEHVPDSHHVTVVMSGSRAAELAELVDAADPANWTARLLRDAAADLQ